MSDITDKERLDFLQKLNSRNKYTGKCELRESETGRGWRLHETSRPNGFLNVRVAIDYAMVTDEFDNSEQ